MYLYMYVVMHETRFKSYKVRKLSISKTYIWYLNIVRDKI